MNLDFKVINAIIACTGLGLCLFYIGMMPVYRARTAESSSMPARRGPCTFATPMRIP